MLKFYISILFRIFTILISFIFYKSVNSQPFSLFAVSDLSRVFEDGYKLPPASDAISLFGIRGEIISGQFALQTEKDITDVTVEVSLLKSKMGKNGFPASAVSWNFVGSIPLTKNTPNQPLNALIRQAPAKFPEYLMQERKLNLKGKTWQGVWLTVSIPESAIPGTYTGKVTVKAGPAEWSLPLVLEVYPFILPAKRHLKIVEWYSTGGFSEFHGIQEKYSPEWFAMLRKYADNMVEHRQNTFRVDMEVIGIKLLSDGTFSFDFSRFDQIADVFWSTGKMDFMETGFLALRGLKGWSDTNFRWKEFSVRKEETGEMVKLPGIDVIPSMVSAFESHLRSKGWLKKTWFHIQDEPAIHNALSWIEFSRLIHKFGPDLIRMDAIETTFLLNDIEIAVPKLDHFATWYEVYNRWRKKGNELWFYTVGIYQGSLFPNKTIDMPLMETRMLHWMNYIYDATGYLHWGWNQWNEDPYKDVGMHIGDAWHVYPIRDGVINSVRWEQMRNGIQDYEYFWMLENKTSELKDSLGSRFSWIRPDQRGKEIAGRVIKGFADHTEDPKDLYNAKKLVLDELISFGSDPGIYVQTNPPEGTSITGGSTVEVLGWTEPETKITVNGRELPVSQQGLFLGQFKLSGDVHAINVEAAGTKGLKTVVRTFLAK